MKDEFRVHFSCVLLALSPARPPKDSLQINFTNTKNKAKQWQH